MCWIFNQISNGTMLQAPNRKIEKSKMEPLARALRVADSDDSDGSDDDDNDDDQLNQAEAL